MQKLVMVMGVQRSGTNALFFSLASDPTLISYNEAASDALYADFFLRPEPEIRPLLQSARSGVLLKPNSETRRRSLGDVFQEYAKYDLHIVWVYRNPVNIFYSHYTMGWIQYQDISHAYHLNEWNLRNQQILDALPMHAARLTIVRYEDAVADSNILSALFRRVGVNGQNRMRGDTNGGRKRLPRAVQTHIARETQTVHKALDRARTFKPALPIQLNQWLKERVLNSDHYDPL